MEDGGSSVSSLRKRPRGSVPGGEQFQLVEVAQARRRALVLAGDHGLEERADPFDLPGGGQRGLVEAPRERRAERLESFDRGPRRLDRMVKQLD